MVLVASKECACKCTKYLCAMPKRWSAALLLPLSAFPVGRRNKAPQTGPRDWLPPGNQATRHQPTAGPCLWAGLHLQHKWRDGHQIKGEQRDPSTPKDGDGWSQSLQMSVCSEVVTPNLLTICFGIWAAPAFGSSHGAKSHFILITRVPKNLISPLDEHNWDRDVLELERQRKASPSQLFQRTDTHVGENLGNTHSTGLGHVVCQDRKKNLSIKIELTPVNFRHPVHSRTWTLKLCPPVWSISQCLVCRSTKENDL